MKIYSWKIVLTLNYKTIYNIFLPWILYLLCLASCFLSNFCYFQIIWRNGFFIFSLPFLRKPRRNSGKYSFKRIFIISCSPMYKKSHIFQWIQSFYFGRGFKDWTSYLIESRGTRTLLFTGDYAITNTRDTFGVSRFIEEVALSKTFVSL